MEASSTCPPQVQNEIELSYLPVSVSTPTHATANHTLKTYSCKQCKCGMDVVALKCISLAVAMHILTRDTFK